MITLTIIVLVLAVGFIGVSLYNMKETGILFISGLLLIAFATATIATHIKQSSHPKETPELEQRVTRLETEWAKEKCLEKDGQFRHYYELGEIMCIKGYEQYLWKNYQWVTEEKL